MEPEWRSKTRAFVATLLIEDNLKCLSLAIFAAVLYTTTPQEEPRGRVHRTELFEYVTYNVLRASEEPIGLLF